MRNQPNFKHVDGRACMQRQASSQKHFACVQRTLEAPLTAQSDTNSAPRVPLEVTADGQRSMGKIKDREAKKKAAHVFS